MQGIPFTQWAFLQYVGEDLWHQRLVWGKVRSVSLETARVVTTPDRDTYIKHFDLALGFLNPHTTALESQIRSPDTFLRDSRKMADQVQVPEVSQ